MGRGEWQPWRGWASLNRWEDENWRYFSSVSFSFSCLDWRKRDKRKSSPRRGQFLCPLSGGEGVSWQEQDSFICWEDES